MKNRYIYKLNRGWYYVAATSQEKLNSLLLDKFRISVSMDKNVIRVSKLIVLINLVK